MEPKEVKLPEQLSEEDIKFILYEWNTIIYNYETNFGIGFQPEERFKEEVLEREYPNLDIDSFYNFFKVESYSDSEGNTQLKLLKK